MLWTLDASQSNLQYVSTRRDHDGEVNGFVTGTDGLPALQSTIERSGQAVLSIDMRDVDTNNSIRNGRLLNFVFEIAYTPTGFITIDLDTDALAAMSVGTTLVQDISGDISLHGIRQDISAQVIIARTSVGTMTVSTVQPILLDVNDFEYGTGIQLLREAANIAQIGEVIPVYFSLSYVANTDVNTAAVSLPATPGTPVSYTHLTLPTILRV